MRCAWHPKYRGYPWVYGVGSWRGAGLEFSDGMCGSCCRRWRVELHAGQVRLSDRPPSLPQLVPAWMPRVGLGIALATALIFAARPLDQPTAREVAGSAAPPLKLVAARAVPALAERAAPLSPRIEPAVAQTDEPSPSGSRPARPRQLTRASVPPASAGPARRAVVLVSARRDGHGRLVATCPRPSTSPAVATPMVDCRTVSAVAVSAPPARAVVVQAP